MLDFAQYLVSCADAEVRREAEQWIVNVYLKELRHLLNDLGKELPDGFDRDRLTEAYQLALITQALRLTVIVSIEQKARDDKRNEHNSRILEAESQKLLLRLRLALEDACRAVDQYAGNFVAKQADESHL